MIVVRLEDFIRGFTSFWVCDNCGPAYPGSIGVGTIDAVGDFGNGPSFRPVVLNNNYGKRNGDQIFDPAAFGPPAVGADLFDNRAVATRNLLYGPGTVGVNLGIHKDIHLTERVSIMLDADANNVFNHPLPSPDSNYGGGGCPSRRLEVHLTAEQQARLTQIATQSGSKNVFPKTAFPGEGGPPTTMARAAG